MQNPTAAPKSWDNFSRGEGRAGWRIRAMTEAPNKREA